MALSVNIELPQYGVIEGSYARINSITYENGEDRVSVTVGFYKSAELRQNLRNDLFSKTYCFVTNAVPSIADAYILLKTNSDFESAEDC